MRKRKGVDTPRNKSRLQYHQPTGKERHQQVPKAQQATVDSPSSAARKKNKNNTTKRSKMENQRQNNKAE